MIGMNVRVNLELDPWLDLQAPGVLTLNPDGRCATIDRIGLLPNGTVGGRACVELLITLPDGRSVIAETTLRLFRVATTALMASPVAELDEP